jgi:hypothetical protein
MHANEDTVPASGDLVPDYADEIPDDIEPELPDPGDLEIDAPGGDEAYWDVFIPDADECDPLPEPGDFWVEDGQESRVESQEPEGCLVCSP